MAREARAVAEQLGEAAIDGAERPAGIVRRWRLRPRTRRSALGLRRLEANSGVGGERAIDLLDARPTSERAKRRRPALDRREEGGDRLVGERARSRGLLESIPRAHR